VKAGFRREGIRDDKETFVLVPQDLESR